MIADDSDQSTGLSGPRRLLPLLLVLFVGSGCSALIYEIVWFQLLQFVIGSTAVSLGVLLGTFMGGMCLGSVALPRLISARRHPLRVYALLELGIGLIGLVILFGMPLVDRVYVASVGRGLPGLLLRGAVCAVCLLPPTVLMGATLPAIARWVETTPRGVSWLGFFYGGNIAGAVFGCLLAGFYLLRVHDVATATYVAALLNGVVAVVGLVLAALAPQAAPSGGRQPARPEPAPGARWVYFTIALSGMSALGAEVVWTRVLSLMLGATVYTFSIILAVFLVGLGVGSAAGSLLGRWAARPRLALGVCQMLLAAAIAWTAWILAESLPYWPIKPSQSAGLPWVNFQLDLVRCLWAILPATLLWGASFPLALAAVASRGQDAGRMVGGVYAANTAGAIAGALGASLVVVAWVGTQGAERILIGLSAAAALLMFGSLVWSALRKGAPDRVAQLLTPSAAAVVSVGLAVLLALNVPALPPALIAWGHDFSERQDWARVLYWEEGMNSSVAVTERTDGARQFHVAGKVEASTIPQDMRLQRMLGHLSALAHVRPRSVLVVGCGAGVTAGTFLRHPSVERIVICEIEPLIPRLAAEYFAQENYGVVHHPKVEIVYDDARHYVLTTQEKFDVITSDPIHPWVKGAATLYTQEYFEACKRRLNPGGVVTLWVPLYESDIDTVKSEMATFFKAFPDGTVWGNPTGGGGYDTVVLGQAEATRIDLDTFDRRLHAPDRVETLPALGASTVGLLGSPHGPGPLLAASALFPGRTREVIESLQDVGLGGYLDLLATYAGRASDLENWLEGAAINRDRNLRLQYLAGRSLNFQHGWRIYAEILSHRTFPDDLFTGPPLRKGMLKLMLEWKLKQVLKWTSPPQPEDDLGGGLFP